MSDQQEEQEPGTFVEVFTTGSRLFPHGRPQIPVHLRTQGAGRTGTLTARVLGRGADGGRGGSRASVTFKGAFRDIQLIGLAEEQMLLCTELAESGHEQEVRSRRPLRVLFSCSSSNRPTGPAAR